MPKVLYRADGGHPVGTGHILRALRITASWAGTEPAVEVLLVCNQNPSVARFIADAALPNLSVHYLEGVQPGAVPRLYARAFEHIVRDYRPDIIVVDMLDTPDAEMRVLRDFAPTLVTLDDRGDGRLHADLICSFLVRDPDPSALDAGRTWLREGPEFASLPPKFAGVSRGRREPDVARRALVTLGGADAAGLTAKVAEDLLPVTELKEVDIVVGAAFRMRAELDSVLQRAAWRANLHTAVPSLLPLFESADLAIVAGGITMHEAACCGVPAVAVCQSIDHQLLVAGWLQDGGCMLNLGYGESLSAGEIANTVRRLAEDQALRQSMSDAGPRVCDGRGSQRTAEAILARWRGA